MDNEEKKVSKNGFFKKTWVQMIAVVLAAAAFGVVTYFCIVKLSGPQDKPEETTRAADTSAPPTDTETAGTVTETDTPTEEETTGEESRDTTVAVSETSEPDTETEPVTETDKDTAAPDTTAPVTETDKDTAAETTAPDTASEEKQKLMIVVDGKDKTLTAKPGDIVVVNVSLVNVTDLMSVKAKIYWDDKLMLADAEYKCRVKGAGNMTSGSQIYNDEGDEIWAGAPSPRTFNWLVMSEKFPLKEDRVFVELTFHVSALAKPGEFLEITVKASDDDVFDSKMNDVPFEIVNGGVTVECTEDLPAPEKPIIYLYPEKETVCSVRLDYNGRFTATYPEYGVNGWENFTAYPDGTLVFPDGRQYYALFWEGVGGAEYDFGTGFCVKGSDTAEFLYDALKKAGLNDREAEEFIIYWLPRMQDNEYNLISFQTTAYTENAKLTVTPEPDTVIRVFMAYKPLDGYVEIAPQTLVAPERNGFTVVEWGGAEVK